MGFKNIFKNVFPFISMAAGIGGPLGTMAASAVGAALGVKVDNTEDSITSAITDAQIKDPDALLKIQQAERDFQIQMEKLGLDSVAKLEQIASDDRASARNREIIVRDRLPAILAISVTLGFFGLLALVVFVDIPPGSQTILNIMIGTLGASWGGIVQYYFGSSAGSAKKTELLAAEKK